MWKDIPFTAFSILFMLNILCITKENRKSRKYDVIFFILFSTLVCVFRSNGIFVWIFTVPFLLWKMRVQYKKWTFASIVVMTIVILYKGVLLPELGVIEPDTIESLSIPAQQISCVIAKGGTISEEAIAELEKVVDVTRIKETYESHTSDPIKHLVREKGNMEYISKNPWKFIKLYINVGLDNIYYYLEAFIEQTKGYWHHKESDWIYHGNFMTDNELGIYREGKLSKSMIQFLENILEICLNGFHRVWSLALFMYVILISIMMSLIKKRSIVGYMPLVGLVISLLMATPRYCDFRYVYLLFAVFPLYMGDMIYYIEVNNKK